MKKILSLILCMVFLISFASALEFDNAKEYDQITREVTFYNTFLGIKTTEIGKARLNTPLNVKVARGYQKVAEFNLWAYEDYNDALKQFEFKDMNKGKIKINRDYDIKFKTTKEIKVNDYANICESLINKTLICSKKISGFHLETVEDWVKITPADLKKNGVLTIGIFTEVREGDFVDWIPMIYGVQVEEWATWTEDLNVDLLAYWKLDEQDTTGSGTIIDSYNSNDGTNVGTDNTTGKINTAYDFISGNSDYINFGDLDSTTGEISVSLWVNFDSIASQESIIRKGFDGSNLPYSIYKSNTELSFGFYDGSWHQADYNTGTLSASTWYNLVLTYDGSTIRGYVNGVSVANETYSGSIPTSTRNLYLGSYDNEGTPSNFFSGKIDEVGLWERDLIISEVTQLYNSGDGISWQPNETDSPPIVILNLPQNNLNYTIEPLQINFSCYASDDINLASVGLYINGILDQLNASGVNNTNYTFTKTLTEGSYNWTCEGTDNESQTTKPTERIFRIHTTNPNATIYYPTGTSDYHLSGDPLVFNWTIQEGDENLSTHITNCTYTYNGVVTEINNTVCTQINQTTFIPVPGVNTLNFTVTDEFGLTNTSSTTWDIKVFEINQSYNNETTEGSLETFLATLRLGAGYSISDAVLINYNGTSNTGQSFAVGSNTVLRKADLLIPSVTAETNVSFYWSITLSDATEINLSTQNQTINNLDLDNCSSYTKELFNFTVVDEEEQTILPNATVEIAINVYDQNRDSLIMNYSNLFEKLNPVRICINSDLNNDSTYSVDTIVRYEDTGNANEYYNIVNQTLTNSTESQKITLYDLNLTDSTEFQLTFTGSDFLPVENALVYVDRQYISENTFKTVELPKTDYNGQSVLHLVRNDVIYNIRIIKDGVVLGNFENLVAFCDDFTIGDCNIELNAFDSVESVFNYNEGLGIIYTSPTYNATESRVSFNFVTSDGSAKTVRLEISRNDIFGNRSICNSSLISSGGTLFCDIDPNIDESVLKVSVYTDEVLTISGQVQLDTTSYGVAGYLIMFVMALSFVFMFSGSKTGVLISLGLTLAGSFGMGIVAGDLIGVGASGIWLLLIIFIGIYKLNKDRTT